MIAAAGASRIREDQDALGATHEGVGLDQVGAPRATFDVLPPPAILDDAARSPCHFGDSVGPKPGDDMIERGSYRRQRAELFEQHVAHPHRSLAVERRSEEHTSELQSLMRTSSAVCCSTKKTQLVYQLLL